MQVWILIILVFLTTRFGFMADFPHYYDSPEYVAHARMSFGESMRLAHESLHPLYMLLAQLAYRLSPTVYAVSSVSTVSSLVAGGGFYWVLYELGVHKKALSALLATTLFPAFWLLHTNILHETVDQACWILGLASLLACFRTKWIGFGLGAVLGWSLSIFNYVGMVLWIPASLSLLWWKYPLNRKDWIMVLGLSSLSMIVGFLGQRLVLTGVGTSFENRLHYYLYHEGVQALLLITPLGMLRSIRNVLAVLWYGYSPVSIGLLAGVSLWTVYQRQWKHIVVMGLWILCFILTMSFWHGGMYGRLGAPIGWFIAGLLALIPLTWVKRMVLIINGVMLVWVVVHQVRPPIPQLQWEQLRALKSDMVVISDYERPQLTMLGLTASINIASSTTEDVIQSIDAALSESKTVHITKQAMTFPYFQYDGQFPHILSLGNPTKAQLYTYLQTKQLQEVVADPRYPFIGVYQIQ